MPLPVHIVRAKLAGKDLPPESGMPVRHQENPLITPEMVKPSHPRYRVRGTFNPGATVFGDEIILLLRVSEDVPSRDGVVAIPVIQFGPEGKPTAEVLEFPLPDPQLRFPDSRTILAHGRTYLTTLSHLRLARSRDGVHFTISDRPFLFPAERSESFGIEDARITRIGDTWWINYTCVSPDGYATALASTRDFQSVERHGIIFHPENKDVCLFPEKIAGCYHALHRPNNGFGLPSIWHARSPDLIHWGRHRCLLRPGDIPGKPRRIGGGAPPIRTGDGWLQLCHGEDPDLGYCLFALLLDLDQPWNIRRCSATPLLTPVSSYEKEGFFGRVVFSNGIVRRDDRLLIYYGAADQSTCLAECSIAQIIELY